MYHVPFDMYFEHLLYYNNNETRNKSEFVLVGVVSQIVLEFRTGGDHRVSVLEGEMTLWVINSTFITREMPTWCR